MSKAKELINQHYSEACRIASAEVERLARTILHQHDNLEEFVMGMGTCFFNTKDDEIISIDKHKYMKPIEDLLCEWDNYLKITGEPMRFTANGPVVRNW